MKPGTRKLGITIGTLMALLALAVLTSLLGMSDGAVEAIARAMALVAIGYCGGNGVEHLSKALAERGRKP